ncbi:FtsH protease activity modulator HflK [Variovorax sp. PCZ-1]|uniref:FtsH protease activity modulator HflK n=1 Tax=Variovorax sp. PCZ-1 TaxID=2835533 RepID=UPI0020BFB983|nr:FtsH protease activity modulator HflK [Variovorax sp. PCZ-1]
MPTLSLRAISLNLARMFSRMFNLNDGKWGRSDSPSPAPTDGNESPPPSAPAPAPAPSPAPGQGGGSGGGNSGGPNQGPPDLDELWRDFNRKLGGLFGGNKQAPRGGEPNWNRHNNNGGGNNNGNGGGGNYQPDMKSAGIGAGLIGIIALLIWLGTGFFIVQEGQQAVITRFGALNRTVDAGFNWRAPYPFERHETVSFTQVRSVEVGRNSVGAATGIKESSMLTKDENIVDVRFTIQYNLKSSSQFLFENRGPDDAVIKAAESAVREVVGRFNLDDILGRNSEVLQQDVLRSVQQQMDRLQTGISVQNVNIQNVQAPEQVQAAFDDALKAGQDRDRLKNEGQAYANNVIPSARGTASRLKEESEGYKARVIAQADGDAQRFRAVYNEYAKAPQVTRDRMYLDTMQQIYSNTTKILVDSRQGNNLLYLPLDKIMQMSNSSSEITVLPGANAAPAAPNTVAPNPSSATPAAPANARTGRERDSR